MTKCCLGLGLGRIGIGVIGLWGLYRRRLLLWHFIGYCRRFVAPGLLRSEWIIMAFNAVPIDFAMNLFSYITLK